MVERGPRSTVRAVAVPTEHGGWGLTLEPALLGLLVVWSAAGAALAVATLTAFLIRTPLKVVLVDRWRHRHLERTSTAAAIAAIEASILVGLGAFAIARSGWWWLVPVAVATPLVAVQLAFDMRSRSRRLLPELAGSVGIAGAAAAIAVAGGADGRLAAALWIVLAARAIGSIPFARSQVMRVRRTSGAMTARTDWAQGAAIAAAAAAILVDTAVIAGAIAVAALALVHVVWSRRPPRPVKVVGIAEAIAGLVVVLATALGVALS